MSGRTGRTVLWICAMVAPCFAMAVFLHLAAGWTSAYFFFGVAAVLFVLTQKPWQWSTRDDVWEPSGRSESR